MHAKIARGSKNKQQTCIAQRYNPTNLVRFGIQGSAVHFFWNDEIGGFGIFRVKAVHHLTHHFQLAVEHRVPLAFILRKDAVEVKRHRLQHLTRLLQLELVPFDALGVRRVSFFQFAELLLIAIEIQLHSLPVLDLRFHRPHRVDVDIEKAESSREHFVLTIEQTERSMSTSRKKRIRQYGREVVYRIEEMVLHFFRLVDRTHRMPELLCIGSFADSVNAHNTPYVSSKTRARCAVQRECSRSVVFEALSDIEQLLKKSQETLLMLLIVVIRRSQVLVATSTEGQRFVRYSSHTHTMGKRYLSKESTGYLSKVTEQLVLQLALLQLPARALVFERTRSLLVFHSSPVP